MRRGLWLPILSVFLLRTSSAAAQCAAPWQRLDENARQMLHPVSLSMVGGAAVAPIPFIVTDADHDLRVFAQTDLGGSHRAEPISFAAPLVFAAGAGSFYAGAWVADWCTGQRSSSAIIQAMAETSVVVGLVKFASGRQWPNAGRDPTAPDRFDHPDDVRDFRPFQRALAAFPSGHTAVMFSAAAALRASSPEIGPWRYAGYPFAAGMAFAMWFGDHHWASDIVSGALLGESIGSAAGRTWAPSTHDDEVVWTVVPTVGGALLNVQGSL